MRRRYRLAVSNRNWMFAWALIYFVSGIVIAFQSLGWARVRLVFAAIHAVQVMRLR